MRLYSMGSACTDRLWRTALSHKPRLHGDPDPDPDSNPDLKPHVKGDEQFLETVNSV